MSTSSKQLCVLETSPLRRTLTNVRYGLLELHKALIVAEQLTFERIYGRIDSTGQLLLLVMNDPWFTWLHPLSNLVVRSTSCWTMRESLPWTMWRSFWLKCEV